MKKTFVIIMTIILCLILGGCKATDYKQGEAMLNSGDFENAIRIFENLGNYKDADDMLNQAKYQKSVSLFEKCDVNAALSTFSEISDYKDAEEYIDKINSLEGIWQGKTFSDELECDTTLVFTGENCILFSINNDRPVIYNNFFYRTYKRIVTLEPINGEDEIDLNYEIKGDTLYIDDLEFELKRKAFCSTTEEFYNKAFAPFNNVVLDCLYSFNSIANETWNNANSYDTLGSIDEKERKLEMQYISELKSNDKYEQNRSLLNEVKNEYIKYAGDANDQYSSYIDQLYDFFAKIDSLQTELSYEAREDLSDCEMKALTALFNLQRALWE